MRMRRVEARDRKAVLHWIFNVSLPTPSLNAFWNDSNSLTYMKSRIRFSHTLTPFPHFLSTLFDQNLIDIFFPKIMYTHLQDGILRFSYINPTEFSMDLMKRLNWNTLIRRQGIRCKQIWIIIIIIIWKELRWVNWFMNSRIYFFMAQLMYYVSFHRDSTSVHNPSVIAMLLQ